MACRRLEITDGTDGRTGGNNFISMCANKSRADKRSFKPHFRSHCRSLLFDVAEGPRSVNKTIFHSDILDGSKTKKLGVSDVEADGLVWSGPMQMLTGSGGIRN